MERKGGGGGHRWTSSPCVISLAPTRRRRARMGKNAPLLPLPGRAKAKHGGGEAMSRRDWLALTCANGRRLNQPQPDIEDGRGQTDRRGSTYGLSNRIKCFKIR